MMVEGKRSKYYRYGTTGINKGEYFWQTDHPDLTPTKLFKVGYTNFCAYCNKEAKLIQAGLRNPYWSISRPSSDYDVTGYTCDCDGAEAERELQAALEELKQKQAEQTQKLKDRFSKRMVIDRETQLRMEYEYKLKELKREYKR